MGLRVQRWADRRPITFAVVSVVAVVGSFIGGMFWLNSTEGAIPGPAKAQLLSAPLAGTRCNHKAVVDFEDRSGAGTLLIDNQITVFWYTDGVSSRNACSGAEGVVTSASWWCSWKGSSGYFASCSAWRGTTHAETDATDTALGRTWHEVVAVDVNKLGGFSYSCRVTSGLFDNDANNFHRCTGYQSY